MKLKLYRDKVVSVVRGKDLVGVYILEWRNGKEREFLLAEMSPEKADKIISLWNK